MRSHVVCRQTEKGKPRCDGFSLREDKSRGAKKSGLSGGPEQKEKRPSESGLRKRRPDRRRKKSELSDGPEQKEKRPSESGRIKEKAQPSPYADDQPK